MAAQRLRFKAFDKSAETARVYLPQHGIPYEDLIPFRISRMKTGRCIRGIKRCDEFSSQRSSPKPHRHPAALPDRLRILQQDAENFTDVFSAWKTTGEIALKATDRILELDLSLLDYERSTENQYAYTLTKSQEQWIHTASNKISIINPPYGRYNLVFKAGAPPANGRISSLPFP